MATKKKKREAALAKREAFLEEQKAEGLAAQRRDHEVRDLQREEMRQIADTFNDRYMAVLNRHGIYE